MKRNIKKAIVEYEQKFGNARGNKGAFYVFDVQAIRDGAQDLRGGDRDYQLVCDALRAGFMVGYKAAKREDRKRKG